MEVQLYNPHPNQRKIHDSIIGEGYKYYILNIGRQFGKSLLAINQIVYWCLTAKCKCAWVAPVYSQSRKVFDEMESSLMTTGLLVKKNRQELTFDFITGSSIQFFSAERYDNIRGFTFDYLVCDEFAFMDEEAWTKVLRATVLVKGKKVLILSTPNGKNLFYQLHALDGVNESYKSFTMTSYDNPLINPNEIDEARRTLPDWIFRQEYLAEFIDGGHQLFNGIKIGKGEITNRLFAGIDIGRADDYTVLSILNDRGEMVYCNRWRQMQWSDIIREIAIPLKEYKPITSIEINSVGDAIYEMIEKELRGLISIEPFITTSKSKQDIIEGIIVAKQEGNIKILDEEWLKKEFEVFTYEYNPKTRGVRYSAPVGFHDDAVMATAIAYHIYKEYRGGRYIIS